MKSKSTHLFPLIFSFLLLASAPFAVAHPDVNAPKPKIQTEELVKLQNPMTEQYLKKRLRKTSPRLILTPAIEANLKSKIKTDPVVQNVYNAIKLNAQSIQAKQLLHRQMVGRRLLGTSREMLSRINILGIVYRIEKDPAVLKRINEEVISVCNFTDWNPSHYLDVAEMSMAVALALDWAGRDLPPATVELAKNTLIEKGIKPSFTENEPGWVNGTNNWNQVCNGGMIAAAIAIADKDPALAAKTISRALNGIPHSLKEYGPDGVYPEGSTYWSYGTSFSVLTSSILESAFGTDFGISEYPAFKKSADFRVLSMAPSDWYYNFADCGDKRSENGDFTLAWFAAKTGNKIYFEKDRFLRDPEKMGELARWAGAGLVWISQFREKQENKLPLAWKGDGDNPVVFFRDRENDPRQFYFGGKGGRGTVSHGNLDAGSFVFELDGVRWSVDPGNQSYTEIEQAGFNLWASCQDCERWKLLTKNNFGHSTLTVNDALHVANGFAPIVDFKAGSQPEATVDLTPVLGDNIQRAHRKFLKENGHSMLIEDKFKVNEKTQSITWQMITTADVQIVKGGAILSQDGKQMKLENLSYPEAGISIISLSPAPHKLDRQIENLKRIEIRLPAYLFEGKEGELRVRLAAVN
jgi:hypothetical protein